MPIVSALIHISSEMLYLKGVSGISRFDPSPNCPGAGKRFQIPVFSSEFCAESDGLSRFYRSKVANKDWSERAGMAHTRIRKFNTRDTYPEQKLDNDLCQAVVTEGGKIVWLRGQCPQNLDDAQTIDSHDPVEQTHKVMQNIKQLIEEAGGEMEHLVKVVVYITDVRHREAVYRTMGEYIKGVHPVSTGLVVQALARPEWLVEIDGTAVIPQ